MPKNYQPRLTIDITEEQYFGLQSALPYGVKRAVFSLLSDQIIEIFKEAGAAGIAAILNGDLAIGVNKLRREHSESQRSG